MPDEPIKLILPKLYPKQQSAIYSPARYSFVEASTKSGKTHGCIAWIIDQGSKLRRGQEAWWVAPVYGQTEIAFNRITRYLPQGFYKKNESKLTVKLPNGGIIRFKSGEKPDNLYGEDVYAAVLDEASRMKEGVWYAVISTMTKTEGPMRIIGNVKGRKNWFYRRCRQAQSNKETDPLHYDYHKITAWDAVGAGVLKADIINMAQTDLSEHVFRELYLAEASDDGGNPFGLDWIEECTISRLRDTRPVAWGWDLAKSVDWTVGIALDKNRQMCRFLRFQKKPWRQTKRIIIKETGDTTPALVDATGVGDPIVEELQAYAPNYEGFVFTAHSKQRLMETLANDIQAEEIAFTDEVKTELEIFEYSYNRTSGVSYSAPEGYNDDMVCALALANKCWRTNGGSLDGDLGIG